MNERTLLRIGLAVVLLLFVLLPARGVDGLGVWPVTLLLAAVLGTVALVGAIVLWRSPPAPPEPPADPGEPPQG